jgi:hypothetical protein
VSAADERRVESDESRVKAAEGSTCARTESRDSGARVVRAPRDPHVGLTRRGPRMLALVTIHPSRQMMRAVRRVDRTGSVFGRCGLISSEYVDPTIIYRMPNQAHMPHGSTHPNRAGFEQSEEDRPNPKLSDQILCDVHLMENFQIYIEFKLKFQFYTLFKKINSIPWPPTPMAANPIILLQITENVS